MVDLIYDERPFHIQVLDNSKRFGHLPAMTDDYHQMTFNQLHDQSFRLANALQKLELKRDQSVLVLLSNCCEYAVIFLATAILGCPISGCNPDCTRDELIYSLQLTGAQFVFTTSERIRLVKSTELDVKIDGGEDGDGGGDGDGYGGGGGSGGGGGGGDGDGDGGGDGSKDVFDYDTLLKEAKLDYDIVKTVDIVSDDVLIAPFSSGTSGKPKCVQITHGNFNAATASLKKAIFDELSSRHGGQRATIAVLPFYHGSGFWALCFCLLEGHHSIIQKRFHPKLLLDLVEKYKVDVLNVVPSILHCLVTVPHLEQWDLSSLNTVLCGSSPLGRELSEAFLNRFCFVKDLIQGYGMTEVVVLSHITPLGLVGDDRHSGSCGKLLPGFEAMIVDHETGMILEAPMLRGELWIRSPAVMKGYHNAINNEDETIVDSNGWLHTGDVVYRDEENFFYIVDRLKDLIKVGGLQVAPAELEDVLLSHESVREVVVVGVDDEKLGQIPMAIVVVQQGQQGQVVDEEELIRFVQKRVAPHKHLRGGVHFVSDLPKTSTGKILRREILRIMTKTKKKKEGIEHIE